MGNAVEPTLFALTLLVVNLLLIVWGTHNVPLRMLWQVVGFSLLYAACWWVLTHLATAGRQKAWLLLMSAVCLPAAWGPVAGDRLATVPRAENASTVSDRLWSVALLTPSQRLARLQPTDGSPDPYEVHVRLASPYHGMVRLFASVNGYELGPLTMPVDEEPDQVEGSATVPAAALSRSNVDRLAGNSTPLVWPSLISKNLYGARMAQIEVWQDGVDPQLRIVAQRAHGGALAGRENSWFFDGDTWRPGVIQASNGRLVPGLWHIFLARKHVGR